MAPVGAVPLNGGEVGYEELGRGSALVFVHGGLTTGDLWEPQMVRFARSYRVIRYDLRGVGRSPSTSGRFSHHEDLGQLLDALGVDRAHMVGHSIGGAVVVDFALTHPDRVRSLTLVASALGGYVPSRAEDRALLARWLRPVEEAEEVGDGAAATEANLAAWLAGPFRSVAELDPRLVGRARELFSTAQGSASAEGIEWEGPAPPSASRLGALGAPTLVMVGTADFPHIREVAERLVAEAARARFYAFVGAAHFPMLESPSAFDDALERFWATLARE